MHSLASKNTKQIQNVRRFMWTVVVFAMWFLTSSCRDWQQFYPVDGSSPTDTRQTDATDQGTTTDAITDASCGQRSQMCCSSTPECAQGLRCRVGLCF